MYPKYVAEWPVERGFDLVEGLTPSFVYMCPIMVFMRHNHFH